MLDEEIREVRRKQWIMATQHSSKTVAAIGPTVGNKVRTSSISRKRNNQMESNHFKTFSEETNNSVDRMKRKRKKDSLCEVIDLTSENETNVEDDVDDDMLQRNNLPIASSLSLSSKSTSKKTTDGRKKISKRVPIQTKSEASVSTATTNASAKGNNVSKIFPLTHSISLATYNVWFGPPYPQARMERIASILTTTSTTARITTTTNTITSTSTIGKQLKQQQSPQLPHLIGLQEVTPQLSETLFPLLTKKGYSIHCQEDVSYGCAIAVKTNVGNYLDIHPENCSLDENTGTYYQILKTGFMPYETTIMARGLLWVQVELTKVDETLQVLFATTHLESYMSNYPSYGQRYEGTEQREYQIQQATSFCEEYLEKNPNVQMAVITGDLNWDDERKRFKKKDGSSSNGVGGPNTVLLDCIQKKDKWKDAWLEGVQLDIRNENDCKEGYTYDSKLNPMLRGNLRRRFDRILYLSREKMGKVCDDNRNEGMSASLEQIVMIGKIPIDGYIYKKEVPQWGKPGVFNVVELPLMPSDHYGLFATVELKSTKRK